MQNIPQDIIFLVEDEAERTGFQLLENNPNHSEDATEIKMVYILCPEHIPYKAFITILLWRNQYLTAIDDIQEISEDQYANETISCFNSGLFLN